MKSFRGFADFYRRFIEGCSNIAKPLTDLTKKNVKRNWTSVCNAAFEHLKERFTTGPIVTHFDETRLTKLVPDASDFVLGAILSQLIDDNRWHPVAFHSRKFSDAEINYDVHDKEMSATVAAFKEWHHLVIAVKDEITVYTNQRNLEYFNTIKVLNRGQHRWAEILQEFNFPVVDREGRLNQRADALTRRRDYCPEGGSNSDQQPFFRQGQWQVQQERDLLRPQVLQTWQGVRLQSPFLQVLKAAAEND